MEIEDTRKSQQVFFDTMDIGQTFCYKGIHYIKTPSLEGENEKINCIDIKRGNPSCIPEAEIVEMTDTLAYSAGEQKLKNFESIKQGETFLYKGIICCLKIKEVLDPEMNLFYTAISLQGDYLVIENEEKVFSIVAKLKIMR